MRGNKVVVVGAAGFLGRSCISALAAAGCRPVGVDRMPQGDVDAAEWARADVLADGVPEAVLRDADVLVHLAWRNHPGSGNADMLGDVLTNVACAVRVFEQAARAGVRRIVYASSGGTIYGRAPAPTDEDAPIAPIGGYGAGKASAELYLNTMHDAHGVQTCALRIANPYGPGQYPNRGQGFIATAIARTLQRQPIDIFGSLSLSRDYVYVADVAEAVVLACADESARLILNVGSGTDLSLAEVTRLVFAAVGHETELRYTPSRVIDIPRMALDISRIEATLGWRPRTAIGPGLARTVEWIAALPPDPGAANGD